MKRSPEPGDAGTPAAPSSSSVAATADAGSGFSYSGTELDALSTARNYYGLLLEYMRPFIGRRVLEIGAGIGTFTRFLLEGTTVDRLVLLEPAENNFPILKQRFADAPNITVLQSYVENAPPGPFDTAIAVNVMEHVRDDAGFLGAIHDRLAPGGHILLFVPALPILFGTLDEEFEHYRRYTKTTLRQVLAGAGFDIVRMRYVNTPGIVPWFITGRILRRRTIRDSHVRLYDRLVIPWVRRIERWMDPPLGQSLIAIARRDLSTS